MYPHTTPTHSHSPHLPPNRHHRTIRRFRVNNIATTETHKTTYVAHTYARTHSSYTPSVGVAVCGAWQLTTCVQRCTPSSTPRNGLVHTVLCWACKQSTQWVKVRQNDDNLLFTAKSIPTEEKGQEQWKIQHC